MSTAVAVTTADTVVPATCEDSSSALDYPKEKQLLQETVHDSEEGFKQDAPESFDDYDVYAALDQGIVLLIDSLPYSSSRPFPVDPDEPEETHQLTFRYALS